jgi:hypothetical protein
MFLSVTPQQLSILSFTSSVYGEFIVTELQSDIQRKLNIETQENSENKNTGNETQVSMSATAS